MGSFVKDLRFALRILLKQPGFFAVAVFILALGIGANSAIFSFAKVALFDPLPYREADRLVMVWQDYRQRGGAEREWLSYPNFADYRAWSRTLEDLAVFDTGTFTLTGRGEPEAIAGEIVSHSFFDLLGIGLLRGRGFLPEEANPGAAPVAIVSHGLWQRRYEGDPDILGEKILLDDEPYTVIGVLPQDFYAPLVPDAEVFLPMEPPEPQPGARTQLYLRAVGRLKPGVTLAQARTDLAAVARRIEQDNPDADRDVGATVYPLRSEIMGDAKPALVALVVTVAFVLLIVCVNVANLLLARATTRRGEIGLRIALGAEPRRLVRQVLSEALLLSLLGGALAVVLAVAGVELLKGLAVSASFPLPHLEAVHVDAGVLGLTLLMAILTGLLFGLAPAFELRRTDVTRVLQGVTGGRSTVGRTGRLLVVLEMALALVLLVGAGLMLRSLDRLLEVDTGYDPVHLLVFEVQTPDTRYPEPHHVQAFYADLLDRLQSLPGAVSAGAVSSLPMGGANTDTEFRIEGRAESEANASLWYRIVTPDYFRTVGLSLLQGRGIEAQDQSGTPLSIVLNESAARQYFPGEDPVGKALLTPRARYEIVGVVQNGRSFGLKTEEPPAVYFPHGQVPLRPMGIVLRTQGDPRALGSAVRATISELDPAMAVIDLRPLEETIAATVAAERALGVLMGIFGLLALTLAGVGLYGLMAYLTRQRTREIGIRMALGARGPSVVQLVLKQALLLSLVGLGLGLLLALALMRILDSMLFEVSALDPISFAAGAFLLTASALLASYLPARRASRLDPAAVLHG